MRQCATVQFSVCAPTAPVTVQPAVPVAQVTPPPAGSGSLIATPVAVPGPLLVTTIVNVAVAPARDDPAVGRLGNRQHRRLTGDVAGVVDRRRIGRGGGCGVVHQRAMTNARRRSYDGREAGTGRETANVAVEVCAPTAPVTVQLGLPVAQVTPPPAGSGSLIATRSPYRDRCW